MAEKCNFCEKEQHQVKQLVMGEKVGICDACIRLCSDIIDKNAVDDTKQIASINPMELKDYLDMYVISQDHAKRVLSVAVANHVKRINSRDKVLEKSNIILLGPSGSGKTLLAETVASYLEVPFVIADATTLTEAGYVGEDVDTMLIKLLAAADGDISLAEKGIVFIDEVDKIAAGGTGKTGKSPSTAGVQQALLKLVEGSTYSIEPIKNEELVDINTKNILFIASGAFNGLDNIKKKKAQTSQIGFVADVNNKIVAAPEFEDLIEFGMIPEFVGRFPIIAEVQELTKEDMLNVLSKVEGNLVTQYKHLFKCDNVGLTFDIAALRQVVNIATNKKTGARSLRSIMEKALLPHMFNISRYTNSKINKVRITKSLINNPKEVTKK